MRITMCMAITCMIGLSACSSMDATPAATEQSCACAHQDGAQGCTCEKCKTGQKEACECGKDHAHAHEGHNCGK